MGEFISSLFEFILCHKHLVELDIKGEFGRVYFQFFLTYLMS